jgi:hypothetical protein
MAFATWDGRSRTAAARARGSGEEQAKRPPQARKLGAVSPREAARLARIESLRGRRSPPSASLILLGTAFICISTAALFLLPGRGGATMSEDPEVASREASPAPPVPSSWTRIAHPAPLFTLDAAEFSKTDKSYEAMRSTQGEGREDRLVFGAAARIGEPFMEIAILRGGAEAGDDAPFFVDLSRRAAAAGVAVAKAAPGEPMPSKFGDMESAEARLSANGAERSCLAFRRAVPGEALRILGWYCPPEGARERAPELSCLMERLELSGTTEDKTLRDAFAAAQARRLGCSKPPPLSAALPASKAPVAISASAASMAALLEATAPHPRGTKPRRRRIR